MDSMCRRKAVRLPIALVDRGVALIQSVAQRPILLQMQPCLFQAIDLVTDADRSSVAEIWRTHPNKSPVLRAQATQRLPQSGAPARRPREWYHVSQHMHRIGFHGPDGCESVQAAATNSWTPTLSRRRSTRYLSIGLLNLGIVPSARRQTPAKRQADDPLHAPAVAANIPTLTSNLSDVPRRFTSYIELLTVGTRKEDVCATTWKVPDAAIAVGA